MVEREGLGRAVGVLHPSAGREARETDEADAVALANAFVVRGISERQREQALLRAQAFRSIGFSVVVNAVLPYLAYRLLEPRFPHASITPLLISTAFPLFGLVFAAARKSAADAIAIISLIEVP